jgi:hypothetical protein
MLSRQEEDRERRETLLNDQRVKEQTGTFLSHTHDDMGGRFSAVSPSYVVGSTEFAGYPAAAAHQRDPVGQEPSLGYRIDELEQGSFSPSQEALEPSADDEAQALPNPADVAQCDPLDVERRSVGLGLSRPYRRF